MRKYVIVVDATCDLSKALCDKYGIVVIPTYITLPNHQEIKVLPEWRHFKNSEEFYSDLKKNPTGYKTAPCNAEDFYQVFEKYAKLDIDILSICISTGLSSTYSYMIQAAKTLNVKYPNIEIHCIDSLRYSTALGVLAVKAAMLRNEGVSLKDCATQIEEIKGTVHQAGWLDDLSFLAKKGRINNAQAFFGTLVGIKPIGEIDNNGLTTVLIKAKGARSAMNILLDYIDRTIVNPSEQIIFIAQTNRLKFAEEYKEKIIERFHPKDVIINDIFPQCGINIGPGLMAAYYFGNPLSDKLVEEKKILEELKENN